MPMVGFGQENGSSINFSCQWNKKSFSGGNGCCLPVQFPTLVQLPSGEVAHQCRKGSVAAMVVAHQYSCGIVAHWYLQLPLFHYSFPLPVVVQYRQFPSTSVVSQYQQLPTGVVAQLPINGHRAFHHCPDQITNSLVDGRGKNIHWKTFYGRDIRL